MQRDFINPPKEPCKYPYHETGKILCWSGTLLSGLSTKETPLFQESMLEEYYDALVVDGANTERNCSYFLDETDAWKSHKFGDPDYLRHLYYRLGLVKKRDLTEIFCLTPYGGNLSDEEIRLLIRATKLYLPNIIYEPINEPRDNERQRRIVEILKEEGIPNDFIQLNYVDSGDFFDLLKNGLKGEGLASYHRVGSMDSINASWPVGWTCSPGTLEMMQYGLCPSNDGANDGHGLNWAWTDSARRSNPEEIKAVLGWSLKHYNQFTLQDEKGRGFEHLSAAGFQRGEFPCLEDAINFGRDERRAMLGAIND